MALKYFGEWFRTFSAVCCALALASMVAHADPPTGNGAPGLNATSTGATITITGGPYTPNLELATTQPNVNTWSAQQIFNATAIFPGATGNCSALPATLVNGLATCGASTSNTMGMMLGPVTGGTSCVASCTLEPSMTLCFARMNTTGLDAGNCDSLSAGGVRTIGGVSITSGAKPFQIGILRQAAACSGTTPQTGGTGVWACRITSATSSATFTFGSAYTSIPVCTASDETGLHTLQVVPATGSVTVTGQGASDVIDIHCVGNPT